MKNVKVALVTGGAKGIGASIVEKLTANNVAVVVNYASSSDAANELVDKIKSKGGQAIAVKADVSKPEQSKMLFDTALMKFGKVDVLVNNAGVMALSPLADTSDEDFNKQFDVNMKGVFNMLRLASTQLHEGGSIINLSTSVVGLKLERYGVYAATKSAVETMSAILSKELRGKNISVNCVAPGPTETDLFTEGKSQEFIDKLANMSPMERLGQPEDIANVVSFLASDEGHWVNGQVLRANGGIV
ncbi:MAG: 3-ketoacyl-ACP reductase [Alteromonas sp.]|jgi:3-oxoacyl-[acyl-carrier protein] reductase|uniref:SDR family oxidoreductase n=1 Tax=uncultured Alteromonas sp. TaxID=179113 RepID=UPI000C0D68CE|nr:SDR family oxidoreductase [uncultured Alteromonas sp.]MBB66859.1 3-ketoacyl-ACP reductase [Rickettsiales bacterium]PHS59798.1 MAG: 3-ketoacyl-ACP reductase [Alteromonas sp.]